MAEGVVKGGGNQLLLEGGLYLGSSEELELVLFFTVRVWDLLLTLKCVMKLESLLSSLDYSAKLSFRCQTD